MLFAEAIQRFDNMEIEANLAEPDVLFLGGGAHLLGRASQQFKMAGFNLGRSESDSGLEAVRKGLRSDGDPH